MIRGRFLSALILAGFGFGGLTGCSSKSENATSPGDSAEAFHIQKAAKLVQEYAKKNKMPKTLAPIEKWALDNKKKGVDKDTFTSTRDHQTYEIVQTPMGPTLREVTGEAGKIFIVLPGGPEQQPAGQVQGMLRAMQSSQEQYQNK